MFIAYLLKLIRLEGPYKFGIEILTQLLPRREVTKSRSLQVIIEKSYEAKYFFHTVSIIKYG